MRRLRIPAKSVPLAIVLCAFALYLYRLDNQSFGFDEGWTSYAIHHSWPEMWSVLIPDNHPPLYYVLVKGFAELAGYADFPVRFFSAAFGTLSVAGLYALGHRLGSRLTGLVAAWFGAWLSCQVYYGQEARMYSLLIALITLSSYSMTRTSDPARHRGWQIAYVLTTCAALYTHYFAALLILAQNVAWLLWHLPYLTRAIRNRLGPSGARTDLAPAPDGTAASSSGARFSQQAGRWFLGQAAILVLYLPWLPTAIRQVFIGQGTWWRNPLPSAIILQDMWRSFILGPRRPMGVPILGPQMGAVTLTLIVGLLFGWRRQVRGWSLAVLMLLGPAALIVLIGSRLPVYTSRYALVAVPGLALVLGFGVSSCWNMLGDKRKWLARTAALTLLAAATIGPLGQLYAYYHDPQYWREDFRRAANYVMDNSGPGDAVILLGCSQPIMQYYQGKAAIVRFPQQGDSVQDEQQVASLLRSAIHDDSRVRLIMYSWETVDPQGLVEGQLRSHCELKGEHWQTETGHRPIRIINFGACDTAFSIEPRTAIDAAWDDQISLSAYSLNHFDPGRQAHIVLWWKTLRRPDKNYSVFVHLVDAKGQMITQFDKLPLSDFYPMRSWPLHVDQRDDYPLKIPAHADLDGASLVIGLYDHQTGQRLPVIQDGAPAGDAIRLPLDRAIAE
jgi:hypothetical protein